MNCCHIAVSRLRVLCDRIQPLLLQQLQQLRRRVVDYFNSLLIALFCYCGVARCNYERSNNNCEFVTSAAISSGGGRRRLEVEGTDEVFVWIDCDAGLLMQADSDVTSTMTYCVTTVVAAAVLS